MKSLLTLSLAILAAPSAGAQSWHSVINGDEPIVQGSGHIVQQVRPTGDFRQIALEGLSNLEVRVGPAPSVTIFADDNLLGQLTSAVSGDTLVLGTVGSMRTQTTPRIVVTVPTVESVRSNGSGNILVEGVNSGRLSLVSQGSGNIVAKGRAGDLTVKLQGSGDADLRAFQPGHADVAIYGSGTARVATNGALAASVFGSGSIYYAGRPQPLAVSENGSGRVIPAQ